MWARLLNVDIISSSTLQRQKERCFALKILIAILLRLKFPSCKLSTFRRATKFVETEDKKQEKLKLLVTMILVKPGFRK